MSKVNRTGIEWCDYSVNPIRAKNRETGKVGWHCERVSEGCTNCYSATLNRVYGSGTNYAVDQTPKVEFFLDEKCLHSMLTFRPKAPFKNGHDRPTVFPFDMTDLFGWWVSEAWIARLWDVFRERADVDWLILTKRSARMRAVVPGLSLKPLPNVWLGVSAENQERADERIPDLLATPAAVRFLSLEPLLEDVVLNRYFLDAVGRPTGLIHWAIIGGESGPKARRCDVSWVRRLVRTSRRCRVSTFVKQLGAFVIDRNDAGFMGDPDDAWDIQDLDRIEQDLDGTRDGYQGAPVRIHLKNKKGGDMAEWPEDLRVRQMPGELVPAKEGNQ